MINQNESGIGKKVGQISGIGNQHKCQSAKPILLPLPQWIMIMPRNNMTVA